MTSVYAGVPLLLGSLCGADMLAAALAAAAVQDTAQGISSAAAPGTAGVRPVQIVLADQPQDVTMQRFRALTDALGQLKQLMGHLMQPDAEVCGATDACNHKQHALITV